MPIPPGPGGNSTARIANRDDAFRRFGGTTPSTLGVMCTDAIILSTHLVATVIRESGELDLCV